MALAHKWITTKLSRHYLSPILWAVVIQLLTLGFTSITFDGGASFKIAVAALMSFWIAAIIAIARRPTSPTKFDRRFIAYGYPTLVLTFSVINIVMTR